MPRPIRVATDLVWAVTQKEVEIEVALGPESHVVDPFSDGKLKDGDSAPFRVGERGYIC